MCIEDLPSVRKLLLTKLGIKIFGTYTELANDYKIYRKVKEGIIL